MDRFRITDAPDLIARLSRVQNHPLNANVDIMTFAGFMASEKEFLSYVIEKELALEARDPAFRYDTDGEAA